MKLSAGGVDYIVHMQYPPIHEGHRSTTLVKAAIHDGQCERDIEGGCFKAVVVGFAIGHPKDQFVKSTGRKIAIGRALRLLFPTNKALRAALWVDYRTKAH